MKTGNNKKYPLQWLAVSTAVGLVGILALQAYWLKTSFSEQQDRFRADIENALTTTVIKSQVMSTFAKAGKPSALGTGTDSIALVLTSLLKNLPVNIAGQAANSMTFVIDDDSNMLQGTALEQMAKKQFTEQKKGKVTIAMNDLLSLPQSKKNYLDSAKAILDQELRNRAIYTPMQLALIDSNNQPYLATCAVGDFKKIPVKSATTDPRLNLSGGNNRLQAAFPDANLYLLRRMVWILSVSAFLILLCAVSFSLLLRLFFKQKKMADIRNDFMNNMTHELKTPISSVSVALEMMQDKRHPMSDATKEEYFAIAKGELQRLTMLVEKVLKMAAFEKSEIQITPEKFLAASWLQDVIASLRPVFEASLAQVTTKVQPELLMFYADKTHLTNVLQNLLENALKYNDKATPIIDIEIYTEEGSTILKIADNGKGIPATYLTKVFDKFFRVPTGDRHETKGYGLGLSYVKAVAELHDGTVAVESKIGMGSTFIITIPNGKTERNSNLH